MEDILALCARVEGNPAQQERLAREIGSFDRWDELIRQAERHGLGPLLYTHLQAIEPPLPVPAKRALQGLYLRHRQASAIRSRELARILSALQTAEIDPLVLKGAALAHLIYPDPGLRPMRDIDLLVNKSAARRTQDTLLKLGYTLQNQIPDAQHHLPPVGRQVEGLWVYVEVHTAIWPETWAWNSIPVDQLSQTAISFEFDGLSARTLGREETLWHVFRHALSLPEQVRLISLVDVVGVVETWLGEMDWDKVKRAHTRVWNGLPMIHHLTPWSDQVLEQLEFDVSTVQQGVGHFYQGWPRYGLASMRIRSLRQGLRDTLLPSEWWLRLYYGVGGESYSWYRWVRHPLHILDWAFRQLVADIRHSAQRSTQRILS
jgi:hypothetical protein